MTSEVENESEKIEDTPKTDIANLEPRMKSVNVTFKVIGKSDVREVSSRRDGDLHRIVDATVGDKTGTVLVPLWDGSIEAVETGKTYTLENGYTGLFRGNLQLKIGRHSELKDSKEEIDDVNLEIDMSAKDHRPERSQHYYRPRGGSGYRGQSYGGGYSGGDGDRRSRGRRDRRTRSW